MKVKPDAWMVDVGMIPTQLFITLIRVLTLEKFNYEPTPLLMLTRCPLSEISPIQVYLEGNVPAAVHFKMSPSPFQVSQPLLDQLMAFTFAIFEDVFNKTYERDPSTVAYWLAPARLHTDPSELSDLASVVDAGMLSQVRHDRQSWSPGMSSDSWVGRWLCDPWNGRYHYISAGVVPGATITSPIPDTAMRAPHRGKKNVIDFTDNRWKATKGLRKNPWDPSQPVLSAYLVPVRRNYLIKGDNNDKSILCHVCPEPLKASQLPVEVVATCLAWPAILSRIESHMIVQEAFKKLDLRIPADLALEAFTKTSDSEEEGQVQSEDSHGMGKNYERLEFIGDSFLKVRC